jgi:hypothetical protein
MFVALSPTQRKTNKLKGLTADKLNLYAVDICGRNMQVQQLKKALEAAREKKKLCF